MISLPVLQLYYIDGIGRLMQALELDLASVCVKFHCFHLFGFRLEVYIV